jgi:hypothetical protein
MVLLLVCIRQLEILQDGWWLEVSFDHYGEPPYTTMQISPLGDLLDVAIAHYNPSRFPKSTPFISTHKTRNATWEFLKSYSSRFSNYSVKWSIPANALPVAAGMALKNDNPSRLNDRPSYAATSKNNLAFRRYGITRSVV